MKKVWLTLLVVILFGFIGLQKTEALGCGFFYDVDVSAENSHFSNIIYLAQSGVINGYDDCTFRPNQNVTNRQVALMIVRALNLGNTTYTDPGYSDVPKNDSAYKEIAIVASKGIFPKGKNFNPNAFITRDEMARVLVNAFNLQGTSSKQFTDVPTSHWAYGYIQALAANDITTGYSDNTFKPKNNLTRGEFASFLTRAIIPEARSTNDTYSYNSGLVPKEFGATYTYREYREYDGGYFTPYVFDSVFDNSSYGQQATKMEGFMNGTDQRGDPHIYPSILDYSEFEDSFNLKGSIPFHGDITISLDYPIKTGSKKRFAGHGENQDVELEVVTTNFLYTTVDGKLYKDVIMINENYIIDGYVNHMRVFFLAKDIGLLAIETHQTIFEFATIEK